LLDLYTRKERKNIWKTKTNFRPRQTNSRPLNKKNLLITVRQYRMETRNNYIVIEARLRFNEGEYK